ncbi:hypothetical protein MPSI1_000185 [Malassezia psittaci]|uniref:Major facilitator superfamily (MFS) profile domain-containing protein n=1 Tax=Malassezia psittaci TaxID=1821823 RepID=A0AAF0F7P8_9BASI|nr:hypothetical protein MPSI1_000185 [Malassezia psittaci]
MGTLGAHPDASSSQAFTEKRAAVSQSSSYGPQLCDIDNYPVVRNGKQPSATQSDDTDLERGSIQDGEFVTDVPVSELPAGHIDADKAEGDIIVDWDGVDDKEMAQNWSKYYRSYITMLIGIFTFCSTFASSAPSQLLPRIMERYDVSRELAELPIYLFLAGYMFGPLFWGPLSELYGALPLLWISGLGLAVFNVGCAFSPTLAGLICMRIVTGFFGSCPLTIGGGVMANMWRKKHLGVAMCVFGATPMCGPSLGPLVGGWIAASGTTYQWVFWAMAIFTGSFTILAGLTMSETNPGVTLKKKAQRIRKQTGNPRYKAPIEVREISLREIVIERLVVPLKMLVVEPMLLSVTLYISFIYGVLYLFFDAYPVVFTQMHGLGPVQTGLTFLALVIGCISGTLYYVTVENRAYQISLKKSLTNTVPPEFRLRLTMAAGPILTCSLFWFAWTVWKDVSIWPPIIAGGFYGLGIFFIMFSLFTYMADTYGALTASAMAANTMVRSAFGVGFPLFATQMYNKLNPRNATTILACVSLVMVPIPFLLHRYGSRLRAKTRYAM